jgi:hypothetical protein
LTLVHVVILHAAVAIFQAAQIARRTPLACIGPIRRASGQPLQCGWNATRHCVWLIFD